MTFHIVAFPHGRRAVVGTVHGSRIGAEHDAAVHARVRGEYVDVEHEGRMIATCDGAGVVPPFGVEDFRPF